MSDLSRCVLGSEQEEFAKKKNAKPQGCEEGSLQKERNRSHWWADQNENQDVVGAASPDPGAPSPWDHRLPGAIAGPGSCPPV